MRSLLNLAHIYYIITLHFAQTYKERLLTNPTPLINNLFGDKKEWLMLLLNSLDLCALARWVKEMRSPSYITDFPHSKGEGDKGDGVDKSRRRRTNNLIISFEGST